MDFSFSPEQRELGSVLRSFLADHGPETEVRRLIDDATGWDRKLWLRSATEIGVQGLAIPERFGGAGCGPLELGVAFEEFGRALVGAPYLASVGLATTALLASGDEQACADHLPGLAAGRTVATLALPAEGVLGADRGAGGWTVSGTTTHVLDGCAADLLLVLAAGGLFAVEPARAGSTVRRTPLTTFDPTRRQARIELHAAPARLIGQDGAGRAAVRDALRIAAVLLAAEQVGGAGRVLEMTVEYAGVREQFGRPIGSFQAIKHKCADMLLRLEGARSASAYALWAAAQRPAELPAAAHIAKSYCSQAYTFCAGECLQIHGGIGFTWEHPAHLYLRRAKSSETMFGAPAQHRAELADLLDI